MNRYKLSKAGVDVNQGLKRLNNDKEFYESLLQKFCEDTHYEDLKAALEQGDTDAAFQASPRTERCRRKPELCTALFSSRTYGRRVTAS